MKRFAFLLIALSLLICPLAMGWEAAVHAKGVQDICKALGFNEEQATCVCGGAWLDGNDVRFERKKGEKKVEFYRNQDRAFNTGVWGEGMPVKTYGTFAVSPNDTRYLNSKKYLNRAIRLAKEGKTQEAFYALGVGVRALQNIFANREAAKDSTWLVQAKMTNGAASWIPGATFSSAWHNVNHDDDAFSEKHSDALKAALEATADYVGEFLAACPQAVENVKQLPDSAIDGIVAETLSLIPLRKELAKKIQQTGKNISAQLDKALATIPAPKTAQEQLSLPPTTLTIVPANWLTTLARSAFKSRLDFVKSDVDDFSGSADADWKAFAKTVDDSLEQLQKSADDMTKVLTDASVALKKASPEDGYAVARKQLDVTSRTFFTSLKPYWSAEKLFEEEVAFWVDVLNGQMREYTVFQDIALLKSYNALKTQLPETDAAFTNFINTSNAAVKEYMGRCENALADFEQEMATIAEAYGKDAAALKTSAAECVSTVRKVFDEKAKQAEESLKGIAPLKQGEAIPKTVDDVIRGLMNDAKDLKDNVLKNIAPGVPNNRQADFNPLKLRSLLIANAIRQDFLRPIDIGSRRPDSWKPAVWKNDDQLEITFVRFPNLPVIGSDKDIYDRVKDAYDTSQNVGKASDYYDRISDGGFTRDVAKDMVGDFGGDVTGKVAGPLFEKGGKVIGKAIGGRFGPLGSKVGGWVGEKLGGLAADTVGDWVGDHVSDALDFFFGEGTSDSVGDTLVDIVDGADDVLTFIDDIPSNIYDFFFGDDDDVDTGLPPIDPTKAQDMIDYIDDTMDKFFDIFGPDGTERNTPESLILGPDGWLDVYMMPALNYLTDMMNSFVSFLTQIQSFLMSILNFAVDIEHIDISSEMDESLRVLTNDLKVMSGKDDEQDKSVVRKATIENKGRDLKRQPNSRGELKGVPAVQQVQMGGDDGGRRKGIGIEGGERVSPRSGGRDNVGRDRIGPSGKPGIYEHANP